jgi:hypothetical protein
MANGAVGVLEAASDQRITIPANNVAPGLAYPNDNDLNQKIQFVQVGGNQYVLQKANTNISLSSNTLDYVTANTSGMAMTTYNTGAGRWQNFGFTDLGNNWFQIKYAWNPNYCVSAGTNSGSLLGVIVTCNSGDNRQRFRVTPNYIQYSQITNYEVWVVGRKRADNLKVITGIPSGSPDVGHAFIALVKDSYTLQKRYNNSGVLIDQTIIDRVPVIQGTWSYWPSGSSANNNSTDLGNANDILTTGGIQNKIYGVRRVRVSASFANSVSSKSSSTKCNSSTTQYGAHWAYLPDGFGSYAWTELPYCTCVDQSVFLWKSVTDEDIGYKTTPDQVTQWIIDKNATDTGYANGGNMIP